MRLLEVADLVLASDSPLDQRLGLLENQSCRTDSTGSRNQWNRFQSRNLAILPELLLFLGSSLPALRVQQLPHRFHLVQRHPPVTSKRIGEALDAEP